MKIMKVNMMSKDKMNAFEALCRLATIEHWCWRIPCTTCGNQDFIYGFLQLARRKHPAHKDWQKRSQGFNPFYLYSKKEKENIFHICVESNLLTIQKNSKFPDWLGYLGVVIALLHSDSQLIYDLSRNWTVQLRNIVPKSSKAYTALEDISYLNYDILGLCEEAIINESQREQKEYEAKITKIKLDNAYNQKIFQILIDIIDEVAYTTKSRPDVYAKKQHIDMLSHEEYQKLRSKLQAYEPDSVFGRLRNKFFKNEDRT